MTVREKINAGHYKNKLPYPDRVSKSDPDQAKHAEYRAAREAYNLETRHLMDLFKMDAISEVCLADHPKADKAYALAWYHGHASGLNDVLGWLEELADLLLD